MSYKKELHKVAGDENTSKLKCERVLLTQKNFDHFDRIENEKTWKDKPKPRSNWYPETPDQHVYGKKI